MDPGAKGAEGSHVRESRQHVLFASPEVAKAQGRFGHLNADEVRAIQAATDHKWAKLLVEDAEASKRSKAAKTVPA